MARYTYVISDIHGQFDALMKMMKQIDFGYDDELYILGDVVDRGEESIECIKWIIQQDNILTLLGNHELLFYDNYIHNAPAVYNTLTQVRETLSELEQKEIIKWIEDMPECKFITVESNKFYLNHTQAMSSDYFKEQLTDRMFPDYSKYANYHNVTIKDLTCIHGHIPTGQMRIWNKQGKDFSIWKNKDGSIIDIDCGAGYPDHGGQLGCLRLNDMKEFYIGL